MFIYRRTGNRNFIGVNIEITNITKNIKEDTLILTCKLGNEIINCYDGTHNKEQLKKWASKKILLCPVCGKPYEYCHGEVKTPYFRHMDKNECEDKYSESETEEHLNGKRDLFEWIKKQNGVTNAVLEGWIPETKQRPDIMFEYKGKKCVIEYQCSPITSEYVERHELYKAVGITDIWILGTEKYLKANMRRKYICDYACSYYSYRDKKMILNSYGFYVQKVKLDCKKYHSGFDDFYGLPIDQFTFDGEIYNFKLGKPDEVKKKVEYRSKIQSLNSCKFPKRHNKYLEIQNRKLRNQISDNVFLLRDGINWIIAFSPRSGVGKNKHHDFIVAEPRVLCSECDGITIRHIKDKKCKRIDVNEFRKENYDLYKKCARNLDVLKNILAKFMKENKQVLLEYKNEKIRFLEVRR